MSDLLIQMKAFFLTLALGIVAGLIFHFYQLTIIKARVGKYSLYILDFFLWIIMICLVFFCMLWINQGEMRLYVLIALVTGILIYYHYLSSRLQKVVDTSARLTIGSIGFISHLFVKPFIWIKAWIQASIIKRRTPPPDEND